MPRLGQQNSEVKVEALGGWTAGVSDAGRPLRVRLDLAYDGTEFSGWAAQPDRRTVEGVLSAALGTVLPAHPPPRLTVGGRTDAGVHARGSVVNVDLDPVAWAHLPGRSQRTPEEALRTRLMGVLPADLVVGAVTVAPAGFDARFSALHRRYSYRLCDPDGRRDPLRRRDTVYHRSRLGAAEMDLAAGALIGLHDFAAYCRRRDGASTVRTLLDFRWQRDPDDGVLVATVTADAFCHSMVRALVGAVVVVGEGRRAPDWPVAVRERGRRDPHVPVMPAHGLCLEQITYPPDEHLAARAVQARAVRRLG